MISKFRVKLVLFVFITNPGCRGSDPTADPSEVAGLAKTLIERAAMEIADARELERLRRTKKAIEAYERVANEFPETPQAKIASQRLDALRGAKNTRGGVRKSDLAQ